MVPGRLPAPRGPRESQDARVRARPSGLSWLRAGPRHPGTGLDPPGLPIGCPPLTQGDGGGSPCACAAYASYACVWTSVTPSFPPCRLGGPGPSRTRSTPPVPGSRPPSPRGGPCTWPVGLASTGSGLMHGRTAASARVLDSHEAVVEVTSLDVPLPEHEILHGQNPRCRAGLFVPGVWGSQKVGTPTDWMSSPDRLGQETGTVRCGRRSGPGSTCCGRYPGLRDGGAPVLRGDHLVLEQRVREAGDRHRPR